MQQRSRRQSPACAIAAFQPPPLPGSQGLAGPVRASRPRSRSTRLNDVAQQFLQEAQKSGMFIFLDNDLKIDQPQATVEIDRDKAAQLGLTMSDVGSAMAVDAGRRLCQLFQPRRALLQSDPAGASSARGSMPTSCINYYIAHRQRHAGAAFDASRISPPRPCRNRSTTSSS